MHYVTTWELTVSGRVVAELDIRATIDGDPDDWSVTSIDLDEIGKGRDSWFRLPREHHYHQTIVEWLLSPDIAWRVEDDYRDYIIGQEEAAREERDEHRMTKRELV